MVLRGALWGGGTGHQVEGGKQQACWRDWLHQDGRLVHLRVAKHFSGVLFLFQRTVSCADHKPDCLSRDTSFPASLQGGWLHVGERLCLSYLFFTQAQTIVELDNSEEGGEPTASPP